MYQHTIGELGKERQLDIEKKSKDAWKFTCLNKKSLLQKIAKKFSFNETTNNQSRKQNNCICLGEC